MTTADDIRSTDVTIPTLAAVASIRRTLAERRYETARRQAEAALASAGQDRQRELLWLLFEARQHLGEMPAALAVLERLASPQTLQTHEEKLRITLRKAQTYHKLAHYDFFRTSAENAAGYTGEEYELKYQQLATAAFADAQAAAGSAAERAQVAAVLRECRRQAQAQTLLALDPPVSNPVVPPASPRPVGALQGRLTFPDGRPVAGATVVLAHATEVETLPAGSLCSDLDWRPRIGDLHAQETQTDADGGYTFSAAPAGRQDFLAVQLDPAAYEIPTRFVAQYFQVSPGGTTRLDAVVGEWTSAPGLEDTSAETLFPASRPLAAAPDRPAGQLRRLGIEHWRNPFDFDFPTQPVELPLPAGVKDASRLVLLCSDDPDLPQSFQLTAAGQVMIRAALPAKSQRTWAIYEILNEADVTAPHSPPICFQPAADGLSALVDTGSAQFRIAWGTRDAAILPPILAVCEDRGRWRGQGRFVLPAGLQITRQQADLLEHGPLMLRLRLAYTLSNDAVWSLELTFHLQQRYVLARETSPAVVGAKFEFSLRECASSGGRGYLHWTPENGGYHWSDLRAEERELARLEESVPWWVPPMGFAYAMTPGSVAGQPPANSDYVAVFTVRRGEWIDREFAKICRGPGANRELDWPFPEMVGSTISMITAHTDPTGDAFFRFGFFDGQRQWGLLVSDLARNDGPFKELSAVQHQHTAPRLQDFRTWHLDEPDRIARPFVVTRRG
ncbi:MAG: carboxypeptidase-like regulatory domain-containing protein, partial [Phycisphaerae bacterium]